MTSRLVVAVALSSAVLVTGCAMNSSSPDVYTASQAQREESVRMGVVESVRGVKIDSSNGQPSGLGAIGGGALGAVAGSALGGGRGSILTGIVGGIAGAVAGNTVENGVALRDGLQITVRLDNGELRAITQGRRARCSRRASGCGCYRAEGLRGSRTRLSQARRGYRFV